MNQKKKEKSSISKTSYDFSVCPTCQGEGRICYSSSPDGYEGVLADFAQPCPTCKGGLQKKAETMKKFSEIPTAFYDKKYSAFNWDIYKDSKGNNIDLSKKRKAVEDFLKHYKKWKSKGYGLYIHSKTKGSGKTFLASCLCNELMELYGIKTKFVRATELLDRAQSGDKESPDEYKREPIKLLCNCEMLVIDDIGQKKTGADWMNEILFRIIDERMTKRLVTIFTSNLSIAELQVDERTISRINKVSVSMGLPEFDVRAKEAYEEKAKFLIEVVGDEK